jgi:hypothetical protein
MGPKEHKPPTPPELEWAILPAAHRHAAKRLQENNWAQGVEGGIDSSHVSILHSLLDPTKAKLPFRERQKALDPRVSYLASDTAPKFFVRPTEYGMRIGARRVASDSEYYWRITQFLLPFFTMIAPAAKGPIGGHAWVPIDDHNTWTFTFHWDPYSPLHEQAEFDYAEVNVPVLSDGSYRPVHNRTDNYGIDRDVQRLHSSTGIRGIGLQDSAIQETMGPIVNRPKEMLGSGDAAIAAFRKMVLGQARGLRENGRLDLPGKPQLYRVRSAGVVLPRTVDFEEGARALMAVA